MPEHYIEISLPTKPLRNVDATITAWSDNKKLGELRISQGGVDWKPAHKRAVKSFSWEKLAELLG